MNYGKHYIKLIRNAQNNSLPTLSIDGIKKKIYTEGHHIFPKSIFGENKTIVILTAKEHYIAHHLLWKYYKKKYGIRDAKTIKMSNAFWFISNKIKKVNSKIYEKLKFEHSENQKRFTGKMNPFYGKRHSKENNEKNRARANLQFSSEENREKQRNNTAKQFADPQKRQKHLNSIKKLRKAVKAINKKDGQILEFESILEASKKLNILRRGIQNCLYGNALSYKGYYWSLKNE